MKKEFGVSINSKVVKLEGEFVSNKSFVDLSNIDNHPALISDEKETLKMYFLSDKSLLIK